MASWYYRGWLRGHYNASGPEVGRVISYIIPHTLLYKIKNKKTHAVTVDILLFFFLSNS